VKLLASAAALVCALVPASAAVGAEARPVDFELAPDAGARASSSARGAVRSAPLVTPRRFNLVGFRWRGRADLQIELRVRRAGRWSRWEHLDVHPNHNPDARRGERRVSASEPIWVGRAGAVQYRLSRRAPGLRLHFVDVGARKRARTRARAAQALPPAYVPRADWGAGGCPPRQAPDYGQVRSVHVHHTVSLNGYTPDEAPSIVLAVCRYHRNSNGWNDIGYNALVDKYGTLYEGRAGGLDQAVIGAHAQGFNSVTSGISNIGDHTSLPQTPAALSAMAAFIRWKLTVHGQPLAGPVTVVSSGGSASRYAAGARVTLERVIGHRDTGHTACPGAALYAQLPELRALVQGGTVPFSSFSTSLSASLGDDRVDYGEPAVVAGTLTAPTGAPLSGELLELQVASDGVWRTSRRVTTGTDGSYASELKPRRRMYVRVRYPGRAPLRRSTSARLLLRLRPVIVLERQTTRAVRGVEIPLEGSVGPRKRTLRLVVQRRVRGRWRKALGATVRARRGRFETSFVPTRSGRYRYYLVAPSDLDTDRAATDQIPLRVVRAAGGGLPARAR
jgi:N-acetylmuramoyl-L-alanine amidase